MSLRTTFLGSPETLQDIVDAAACRLTDAESLLARGRTTGSVYVAGYVSEISLKVAFSHLAGMSVSPRLQQTALVRAEARRYAVSKEQRLDPEGLHSLMWWSNVVLLKRRDVGIYHGVLDDELRHRATALHADWSVELRYRPDEADLAVAQRCLRSARWFYDHRNKFHS